MTDINMELQNYKNNLVTAKCLCAEARLVKRVAGWNDKTLRLFAADCAERVLPVFEKEYPADDRPRRAIQAARDFANGLIGVAAREAEKKWQLNRLLELLGEK